MAAEQGEAVEGEEGEEEEVGKEGMGDVMMTVMATVILTRGVVRSSLKCVVWGEAGVEALSSC